MLRAVLKLAMKIQVPKNAENFLATGKRLYFPEGFCYTFMILNIIIIIIDKQITPL
jgi:hypothetical protein